MTKFLVVIKVKDLQYSWCYMDGSVCSQYCKELVSRWFFCFGVFFFLEVVLNFTYPPQRCSHILVPQCWSNYMYAFMYGGASQGRYAKDTIGQQDVSLSSSRICLLNTQFVLFFRKLFYFLSTGLQDFLQIPKPVNPVEVEHSTPKPSLP